MVGVGSVGTGAQCGAGGAGDGGANPGAPRGNVSVGAAWPHARVGSGESEGKRERESLRGRVCASGRG